ncbi:MAG: hypothetical protein AB1798_12220, partial [Spirochaetota bacterium]
RGFIVAGDTGTDSAGQSDFLIIKLNDSGNEIWKKTFGGTGFETALIVEQTTDGGYILAGGVQARTDATADLNVWILKLDDNGNIVWEKTYGGDKDDRVHSGQQTSDGGYIFAGGKGDADFWVFKLDSTGNLNWEKTYGGTESEMANSIQETDDGGYIVAGSTWSYGEGLYDVWVLKIDIYGNEAWSKSYGGANHDQAYSVRQTFDGGYVVVGYTKSFGSGEEDILILKIGANGECNECFQ